MGKQRKKPENKMDYIPAPSCPAGKHILIDAETPWYVQCEVCGTRFALVAESVLDKAGIDVVERPVTVH